MGNAPSSCAFRNEKESGGIRSILQSPVGLDWPLHERTEYDSEAYRNRQGVVSPSDRAILHDAAKSVECFISWINQLLEPGVGS